MPRYALHGEVLETETSIQADLDPSGESPTLVFTLDRGVPRSLAETGDILHESDLPGIAGESLITLLRDRNGAIRVRYSGTADFILDGCRVHCVLFDPEWEFWIEIALLGPIMSLWLELRGRPALHASAVTDGSGALVFLASSKGGKTSLATAFVRTGSAFLTDDILAVARLDRCPAGLPGPPTLRIWPEDLRELGMDPDRYPRAHPHFEKRRIPARALGRVHRGPAPLRAILLPVRHASDDGTTVALERLETPAAIACLAEGAFARGFVERIPELQKSRLSTLAEIAGRVPVCRFSFPDGAHELSRVRRELPALLDDAGIGPAATPSSTHS